MKVIFLEPVYKDYIWGGDKLKKELNKKVPYDRVAESWEISSNDNGICKIINSEYGVNNLKELFELQQYRKSIFGNKCMDLKEFPLLIKFIDAKENLSIQVHPDDESAKKMGMINGKSEMWYVLQCSSDGKIIGGIKENLKKEELKTIIENDNIYEYLNFVQIRKGDSIYIPSGTVHAILKDTLICEIQQNSDVTYRVYDWNRKDINGKQRKLNKKEAIEVINSKNKVEIIHDDKNNICQNIVDCEFFNVQRIICKKYYKDISNNDTFYAINIIEGKGILKTKDESYDIEKGNSFLIPSSLGSYELFGDMVILKSYII